VQQDLDLEQACRRSRWWIGTRTEKKSRIKSEQKKRDEQKGMKSTISSNSTLPAVGGLTNLTSFPTAVNFIFRIIRRDETMGLEDVHFSKIFVNSGYVILAVTTGKARLLIPSRSLCLNNASTQGPKSRATHVKLWSDEELYFGIASSKLPDEVLASAPNLFWIISKVKN
jgi:hypothetical protein